MPETRLAVPSGLAVREWDVDGVAYDPRHARTHLLGAAAVLALTILREAGAPLTHSELVAAVAGDDVPGLALAHESAAAAIQDLIDLGLIDRVPG